MRVAVKSPGRPWNHMWVENKLDTLQRIVGGYIEHTTTRIECGDGEWRTVNLLVDEEGKLKGKDLCWVTHDDNLVGTIIALGVDGDEFTDLPDEIMKELVHE